MKGYKPYYTEDGSIGLYSFEDKDVFHSKFGALTEAWEKFVIPAQLDTNELEKLKVLDVCYGIGYNTKALMSFLIKNINFSKKNFLKKFIIKVFNIVSICINKLFKKGIKLLKYNVSICDNKNYSFEIDCLEINEELVKLSPLFKTIKTPGEIYDNTVPQIFTYFKSYYTLREAFENFMSHFLPRNSKEIHELLDLKFRNMRIDKEYKIHNYVNYILLDRLTDVYKKDYYNNELKEIIQEYKKESFFEKSIINYVLFNQILGYNKSSKSFLSSFLHNIYYAYLSKRDKKVNFKTAQSLFKLNFHVKDARKTILSLDKQYDLIFLDAFTYTKAPQLWSVEFIAELYKRLAPRGVIMTYSTSAQVRNTFLENNLYVGKIYNKKTNKVIGTIASKDKTKIDEPLTPYEIGLCNTKAGIPYHDPNLSFSSKEIMELREYEFRHSELMSSSKYMKIRNMNQGANNDDKKA